jgi:hypothetical protein
MKIKCTSKRKFKKLIKQMLPRVLMDLNLCEIYASDYYKCGINTYKGMEITYINKVWMYENRHQIYIGMKGMWKVPNQ